MEIHLQHHQSKLPVITVIPKNKTRSPTLPLMEYVAEAERLRELCEEDKAELTAAGLNWDVVTDLPVRIETYHQADRIVEKLHFSVELAKQEITAVYREARTQCKRLLGFFRHAFRNHPDLLAKTETIAGHRWHPMRELCDITDLGLANPGPLMDNDFDPHEWGIAADIFEAFYDLFKDISAAAKERGRNRLIRDQAFTHLKEAVDEISHCAQGVFKGNKARMKGYRCRLFKTAHVKWESSPADSNPLGLEGTPPH